MRKFTALTEHLVAFTGLPPENFKAWADLGSPEPTGRHLGVLRGENGEPGREQVEVCIWIYNGVIQIERFPGQGTLLVAEVMAWIQDNDMERDQTNLAPPEINIEGNDAFTCDIEISIDFEERLVILEDPQGRISFNGKKWNLAEPEIVPAESFTLIAAQKGAHG